MFQLLLYVGFALGVSFLCSLLEAAVLSTRLVSLTEKRDAGSRGAGLLLDLKQRRIDDALSAILTLNTVANTLGATMAGAQAARVFGDPYVGLFSGVLTFLILIVSEIIPKTICAVYSGPLSGVVGWTLHGLTRAMVPILLVSRGITRLLTRGRTTGMSRNEVSALVGMAARDGAITAEESRIFDNLLRFNEIQVEDVMTPRTVTFIMSADATIGEMLNEPEAEVFSRIPLYRDDRDNIVGYVLQRDLLRSLAQNPDRERLISRFMRPISFIPELATVGAALKPILEQREPLAMVTDEHGGIAGLVTLEDLTETILGVEIVDESDRTPDMRKKAMQLRNERLERLRRKRQLTLGQPDVAAEDTDASAATSD